MIEKLKKTFTFNKSDWKAILIIAALLIWQFGSYFVSKFFQHDFHVVNGEIDNHIPLIKYLIIFYVIWYFMIVIIPFMISRRDRDMFHVYAWTYFIMFLAALITFLIYPSFVDRPDVQVTDFWSYCLNLIYINDSPPINALPSGHTMAALILIYITLLCDNMKIGTKTIIVIINILTIMSTVLIKQHAFIDLIYGALYATIIFVVVWLIYYKVYKKS